MPRLFFNCLDFEVIKLENADIQRYYDNRKFFKEKGGCKTMNAKKIFCEECRDDVDYIVASVSLIGTLSGKTYRYVGKEARCVKCGSPLFMPDFLDYNRRAFYDVYRRENNIVSLEQIREIPKKYGVGERPLSLLLGWDERDFSRYADGDIPSKERSDILVRLYNDPAFFAELLQTDEAHENSRKEQ